MTDAFIVFDFLDKENLYLSLCLLPIFLLSVNVVNNNLKRICCS